MKKDTIMPPLVLTVICLIVTAALVVTYNFTLPRIEAARALAADNSRSEVFAAADSFTLYEGELPENVADLYWATKGGEIIGCVITSTAKGYGGTVTVMSGYDLTGTLVGVTITGHSETPGLGTKVAEATYLANYQGLDEAAAAQVDAVSGATITSNALKAALTQAFVAYQNIFLEEVPQ